IWKDQPGPASLRVRGARSQWAIAPGISLGTSLAEIERVNGGPFALTGFAWDYSGTIVGWQGGRLEHLRTGVPHVFIRLQPTDPSTPSTQADYDGVMGERYFSSSIGPMQRLNPRVYE